MSFVYSDAQESDIQFLAADRQKCFCGNPTGDCAGDSKYHGAAIYVPPEKKDNPRATFRIPRRIYETQQVGSRRVKRLIYSVGDKITPEEAQRLGLMPKSTILPDV